MSTISRSSWIGKEGRMFERVALVFEGLGYSPPNTDTPNGEGGYVSNIASQYIADFNQEEVLDIIKYAQVHTVQQLTRDKQEGWIDREAVFGERSL